jgi:hypothetical protein
MSGALVLLFVTGASQARTPDEMNGMQTVAPILGGMPASQHPIIPSPSELMSGRADSRHLPL